MAQIRWTPQAVDDLEAICLFIARDAPSVAAVFAQRAFDITDRLANFPESGRIVPETNNLSIREIKLWTLLGDQIQRHTNRTRWIRSRVEDRDAF